MNTITSPFVLRTRYVFHPVGQGLFASGSLCPEGDVHPRFRWVYDCGTSSNQGLLDNAIRNLLNKPCDHVRDRPKIDLVAISHFDRDHISGLVKLLERFHVDVLLLPYMPLWQRLILAFAEGAERDVQLMRFLVNPIAFLAEAAGFDINQIVLVQGASGEVRFDEGGEPLLPPSESSEWRLTFDPDDIPTDDSRSVDLRTKPSIRTKSSFLKPGTGLRVSNFWEFVPYNDQELATRVSGTFQRKVEKWQKVLLNSGQEQELKNALKEMKECYRKQFGQSSRNQNLISLFLYGGPTRNSILGGAVSCGCLKALLGTNDCCVSPSIFRCSNRFGILYTGDGFLNTPRRLKLLKGCLGPSRITQMGVFQVMHHGALNNWHSAVAQTLKPEISVFCSDPNAKPGHPHAPVLRDFWSYGALQVDTCFGATICGELILR